MPDETLNERELVERQTREVTPDVLVACTTCGTVFVAEKVVSLSVELEEELLDMEYPDLCRRAFAAGYLRSQAGPFPGMFCACGGKEYRTLHGHPFDLK